MTEQEFTRYALENWGDLVLSRLSEKIRQRKVVLSGDLLRSLRYKVVSGASGEVAKLLLSFQDSGRIKDMRQINRRRQAPVSEMEEFVRKVGLQRFRFIPGYPDRSKVPSEAIAVNRIAWGIVRRQAMDGKHKPKKWFSKTFYGTIDALIERLLEGYQSMASEAVTTEFKDGGKG